jgi:hypothetical protein
MCVTQVRVKDAKDEVDDDDIEGCTVPGHRSVEHECSGLSMQLWRTSRERMPFKARHNRRGKQHGSNANSAVFSTIGVPGICTWHTLLPKLAQSSGSRGYRMLDSLSGRRTRVCPPRSSLDGHKRQLHIHKGFMRAVFLLHNSSNISAQYEPKTENLYT